MHRGGEKMSDVHSCFKLKDNGGIHITLDDPTFVRAETVLVNVKSGEVKALLQQKLHSLGIAKVASFAPNTTVLDIGTGGGFPGIPLAILFPETTFTLVDSIGKKIKVVNEVASAIGLKNVSGIHARAEELKESFDFIVSRAVTAMPVFLTWTEGKIKKKGHNSIPNGILYLKGGDLSEELSGIKGCTLFPLNIYFKADFFDTKKVVHLPIAH
jgi:16S rRNA (guanine527-N7)-methyltransferase